MPTGHEGALRALLAANPRSPLGEEEWSPDDVSDWGRLGLDDGGGLTEL